MIGAQLIAPLVAYNFGPETVLPRFALTRPNESRLETAGKLITELVAGRVITPDEPWIRGYLGLPARQML